MYKIRHILKKPGQFSVPEAYVRTTRYTFKIRCVLSRNILVTHIVTSHTYASSILRSFILMNLIQNQNSQLYQSYVFR